MSEYLKGENGYCICIKPFSGHGFLFEIDGIYNYELELFFDLGNLTSEQYLINDNKQNNTRLCFSNIKVFSKIQLYQKEHFEKMCFKNYFITLGKYREKQINSILEDYG